METGTWRKTRREGDKKFNDKRTKIIEAAAKLVREQGYENTSLNNLAELLTITKPTLYYYFKSKDELILAIKRRAQDEAIEFMERARYSDARGIEKLKSVMVSYGLLMTSDIGRCLAVINNSNMASESREIVEERTRRADDSIFAILDQAVEEGDIELRDRTVAYHAIFGSLNWIPNWFNPNGRIRAEDVVALQADILVNGLRSRPDSDKDNARTKVRKPRAKVAVAEG